MTTGRQLALGLMVGLVAGILVLAAAAVIVDDDSPVAGGAPSTAGVGPSSTAPPFTAPDSNALSQLDLDSLDATTRELVEKVEIAKARTYHVVYHAIAETESGTNDITIELWRRPPSARRDTTIRGANELATREYFNEQGYTACFQATEGLPFSCVPGGSTAEGVDPGDVLIGAVDADLAFRSVSARDDVVGTRAVRCFVITGGGDPQQEICLDRETSIPVVIDAGDGRLEASTLETDVPDDAFQPPAGSLGS